MHGGRSTDERNTVRVTKVDDVLAEGQRLEVRSSDLRSEKSGRKEKG